MAADTASLAEGDRAAVMMADLARSRQDELPLQRRPKAGVVTYAPTRNNGTSHISAARKNALAKGWGEPIKDEESEQVETLALADCPWRRAPRDTSDGFSLFNRPQNQQAQSQRSHGPAPAKPRMPLRDNTLPTVLFHRPEKRLEQATTPAADAAEHKTPTKQMAGLSLADKTPVKTPVKAPVKAPVKTPIKTPVEAPVEAPVKTVAKIEAKVPNKPEESSRGIAGIGIEQCDFYFESPNPDEAVIYPYRGYCMVYPDPKDFSIRFAAKFAIELHLETAAEPNMALMHLETDGLSSRSHNVLDLAPPRITMDGHRCILQCQTGAKVTYYLGLKDPETTTLFMEAIEGIQKALEAVIQHQESTVTEQAPVPPTPTDSLVNFDPEPDNLDDLSRIVEEVMDAIRNDEGGLLSMMSSMQTPDNDTGFTAVSEAMYNDWKERTALSRFPSMRQNFEDLMSALVKIGSVLNLARDGNDQPAISNATMALLQPLDGDNGESDSGKKVRRYDAEEMLLCRRDAKDCSEALKSKTFLPPRHPSISPPQTAPAPKLTFTGPFTPAAIAPDYSIFGLVTPTPSKNVQSARSVNGQGMSAVVTRSTKGLSSSMYAH